jgi:hypothetical protein
LRVPALPLQSALVQTCAERPQVLLSHLHHADKTVREVLGRVLGEVATPSLGPELLRFADDDLPELRAAAARGLSYLPPGSAVTVLSELARDSVWFVRLRAIVSLAKLCHKSALPFLLEGLTDPNRLVRLRAAEGLVTFKSELVPVFGRVLHLQDQYGLLAMEITADKEISSDDRKDLFEALRTGKLSTDVREPAERLRARAAAQS